MVVLDVPAGGLELVVALVAGGAVIVVEDVELELGRHAGGEPALRQAGQLRLQDGARAVRQFDPLMVADIAHDEGGARQPGDHVQGREVRLDDEVAVAFVPRGRGEARDRLHLHVDREQVVAGVPLVLDRIQKEPAGDPLADQPALHVGEGGDDGVDLAVLDQGLELGHGESAGHS